MADGYPDNAAVWMVLGQVLVFGFFCCARLEGGNLCMQGKQLSGT
jgi:hypothetical protein